MTAADQPTTEPTAITVPRLHVTHGPQGIAASLADADYLRAAVRNIKHQNRGERLWGSGVTAMVSELFNDAADALLAPAPQAVAETEREVLWGVRASTAKPLPSQTASKWPASM